MMIIIVVMVVMVVSEGDDMMMIIVVMVVMMIAVLQSQDIGTGGPSCRRGFCPAAEKYHAHTNTHISRQA